MKNTYTRQDIIQVLKGAAFLGAGGGGSYEYGLKLLDQLEAMGYTAEFDLLSVDEMEEGKYAGMVAALGQPTAIDLQKLSADLPAAYKALKIAANTDDHELKYLYSGEMGGFNTMVPIFLSIISGKGEDKVSVVDADSNGRAVPELGTCLTNARGIGPAPLAMAGHKEGEAQYRYISWPKDAAAAEEMARKLGGSWYDLVGFSTWLLSREEIEQHAGVSYISYARRIGAALDNKGMPLFDALHAVIPQIKELFSGRIEKIITDGAGGFDKGKIIISGETQPEDKICIIFQNESLVVGKWENGEVTDVYMTAPDLISMVDADTRKPLTNDVNMDIAENQKVTVYLSPAHYYWWDNKKAYECFRHVFEANGYKGEFVKYNPLYESNRMKASKEHNMLLQLAYASEDTELENNLADYMHQHLYYEEGFYISSLLTTNFYSKEEPAATEPTITEQDMVRNGPEILRLSKMRYADREKRYPWAGHYISHFGDEKTTRAAREATSRPVFDAFEPAVLLSLALAENIGIITWPKALAPTLERRVAGAGLTGRITAVTGIDAAADTVPSPEVIAKTADMMIAQGVQCIIIGRSFFAKASPETYRLAERVQEILRNKIPVVDANKVGARWLELNAHMGYFHSRLSYYTPPAKNV